MSWRLPYSGEHRQHLVCQRRPLRHGAAHPPGPAPGFRGGATHTNADLSHPILDGLAAAARIPRLPRAVPVSSVDHRFVSSLDPDADGLVRVEVLGLGPPQIGGLGKHELRVELHESTRPPHAVVVSTDAPADAIPERWEADVPELAHLATLRAEHCAREDSLVVTVASLLTARGRRA